MEIDGNITYLSIYIYIYIYFYIYINICITQISRCIFPCSRRQDLYSTVSQHDQPHEPKLSGENRLRFDELGHGRAGPLTDVMW